MMLPLYLQMTIKNTYFVKRRKIIITKRNQFNIRMELFILERGAELNVLKHVHSCRRFLFCLDLFNVS